MAHIKFNELRAIASSGGGMRLNTGGYSHGELRSIAASASKHQATIILTGLIGLSFDELRSIASSGQGCVIFEF